MEQNKTIWQRLSQTFGPNSLLGMDEPTYRLDKKVLLRTTDKKEYEREKLQMQQSLFISDQWKKIENNLIISYSNHFNSWIHKSCIKEESYQQNEK
jgi:hypothetical protein